MPTTSRRPSPWWLRASARELSGPTGNSIRWACGSNFPNGSARQRWHVRRVCAGVASLRQRAPLGPQVYLEPRRCGHRQRCLARRRLRVLHRHRHLRHEVELKARSSTAITAFTCTPPPVRRISGRLLRDTKSCSELSRGAFRCAPDRKVLRRAHQSAWARGHAGGTCTPPTRVSPHRKRHRDPSRGHAHQRPVGWAALLASVERARCLGWGGHVQPGASASTLMGAVGHRGHQSWRALSAGRTNGTS